MAKGCDKRYNWKLAQLVNMSQLFIFIWPRAVVG